MQRQVNIMRKQNKVRLELTVDEKRILWKIMLLFRNRVLREGKPTEDIDALLCKLM